MTTKKPISTCVYEINGKNWMLAESNIFKSSLFRLFEWMCVKRDFDIFLCCSKNTQTNLLKNRKNKRTNSIVIYPQVKCDVAKLVGKINKNFIYYGRVGRTKGVWTLVNAIRKIKKSNSAFSYQFDLVVGKYPERERQKIISFVKKYQLDSLINIYEPFSDKSILFKKIKQSYAVIVPSLTEGFGYSAFEACTMGKVLICSNTGSLPEVVFGKVSFFKRGDSDDLADKIIDLTASKKYVKEIKPPITICDNSHSFNLLPKVYDEIANVK